MGLEIPDGLRGVASVVVGTDWPEADEAALRRLAAAWDSASAAVGGISRDGDAAMAEALGAVVGDVDAAMRRYWAGLDGSDGAFAALVGLCDRLAQSCDRAATDIEHTKLTVIAALVLLAAELASLAAAAIPTLGASTAAMPAAQVATGVAVRIAVRELLLRLLADAARSTARNAMQDGAVQVLQILQGHRRSIDTDGLVSGAIEGFVDDVVSVGVNTLGSGATSTIGRLGVESVAGAAGSVAGAVASGEDATWQDLTSGGLGGALGALEAPVEPRRTAPRPTG
ncbi:hypothetical protein [Rhodococcus kronopolitis]|uniref:Outer membrane channel protein CpnT-like N-terminal domain-containing protein n=1 Tax=Rhodococcus kronopolitis TaxID=1460226 RepID=A0ABV9FVG1_9NOCA